MTRAHRELGRFTACAAAAAIALSLACGARAELTEEETAALFQEGLARFDAGDPMGAAETWEKLVAEGSRARAWRVLYNLGLAYEAAGERPKAIERFEGFVRRAALEAGALPPELEERRQDAVDRANRLRPALSLLRVSPSASGERVAVVVDQQRSRDAGFETYLEPGRHVIVMGEGERAVREEVVVSAGETKEIVARQLPPPEPPPPPKPAPRPLLIHPGILIAGGALTAASVALPVSLYFRAKSLRDDAEAIPRVDPAYPDARDEYQAWRTGYFVSWAAPALIGSITLSLLVATVVDNARPPGPSPVALGVGPTGASILVRFE